VTSQFNAWNFAARHVWKMFVPEMFGRRLGLSGALCAALLALGPIWSGAAVAQTPSPIGGGTLNCSGSNCTIVGGLFNGGKMTFDVATGGFGGNFGNCTVTGSINSPGAATISPGCNSTLANSAGLGTVSQNTSQVGVDAAHTRIVRARDALQGRGSSRDVALSYSWNPDEEDSAILNFASKSVSKSPVFKAMPQQPPVRTVRYAIWGQGFGDIEWRSADVAGVDLGRTTATVGAVGGADMTVTNIFSATDAYVLGVLGSFMSAHVKNNDGSTAQVDGPGVGVYGVYVNGGFSTDATFKVDFFDLNRSTAGLPDLGLHLTNFTISDNVNYKFDVMSWWVEPTVGFSYTATVWDNASKFFGFEDGHTWRLQGGVRVGTTYDWNGVKVEPTVTGMAYSDVEIRGGTVAAAAGGALVPTDEGKVFGQGLAKLNFIWNPNFSSYIEGEVRGREGVLGTAGRLGLRYTF
jgi:hypothetical protein